MSSMNTFSLSRRDPLPTAYKGCSIRTDYCQILRIFRMLHDPEIDDKDRTALILRMFYVDRVPRDAIDGFEWFAACGERHDMPGGSGKRDFDYEQDAQEIYAAFWQVYRIDLFSTELHWWQFSALLNGLFAGENALSNKVRIRHADDSGAQKKAAADRAKRAAEIKHAVSITDQTLHEQLKEKLLAGADISDILAQMR